MADQRDTCGPDPALYPDIVQAGSLRAVLQAQFDAAGLAVRAQHLSSPGWRHTAAEVRSAERNADVVMGLRERAFCLQFWTRGVVMARGTTDELSAVTGSMHGWQSGMRVGELTSAWPFLSANGFAEAFERGDAEAIDHRWRRYHDNSPPASHLTRLHPFIALAFHQPRLRALLPYTSHWTLRFSRTVGHPYSRELPSVHPLADGRYRVITTDGHELGTADAAGCVALVLTALGEERSR
ncbi:DUF6193 family natural product biosynthesis protein [Micromonospora sp. NPDC047074]|uniref:DUF6193 family natural product biosynthesis protein n=1 Tax=Micromonospora sp. NPDC047074 TaxID=3154339 RepID=UPI0033CA2DB6